MTSSLRVYIIYCVDDACACVDDDGSLILSLVPPSFILTSVVLLAK